jgi:hypothetical protein
MRRALVLLGVLLIVPSEARADEIRLKNGSVIHGKIVREDKDVVVIDLGRGRMNVARRDITAVRRTPEPAEKPDDPNNKRNTRDPADHSRDAVPPQGGAPRPPFVPIPRKKKERGSGPVPGGGPKVVPVERTSPSAGKSTGPDAGAPSRKSAKGTGSHTKTPAPSAEPDW